MHKKTVLGGQRDPRRNSFSAFYPFYRIGIIFICISCLEYKSYNSIGLSLTNLFSRQSAIFVCRLFVDELLPERLYRRLQVMRNYGMSCGSNDVVRRRALTCLCDAMLLVMQFMFFWVLSHTVPLTYVRAASRSQAIHGRIFELSGRGQI